MSTITVRSLDEAVKMVAKTAEDILRVTRDPVLGKQLAILATAGAKQHFVDGVSPDGTPWAPLRLRAGKPLRDTGVLMAATTARAEQSASGVAIALSNNRVQARLHNEGGTVTPKRAKYLAVPLTDTARKAGSPRQMVLFPRFRKGGRAGVLVDKKGVAQFALVKSVVIPQRRFLGFSEKTVKKMEDAVLARARAIVKGGSGNG